MDNEVSKIKIHFMYVTIILTLVSVFLGGALLKGHDGTITTLSNGSLLLSIVLAVLAILITLWDVAGQKNNVASLQSTVKGLRKIIVDFEKISEENGTSINELKEVIGALNDRVILYESKFAQIENLINSNTDESKIKKDLQELLDKNINVRKFQGKSLPRSIMLVDVLEILKMEYQIGEPFKFSDFFNLLGNYYDVPSSTARKVLNRLVSNGDVEERRNDEGNIFYNLVPQRE